MFQDIDLRQLASLEGPPRSFITFYFTGEAGLNLLDQRVGRLRAALADEPVDAAEFERSVDLLKPMLADAKLPGVAYAAFACEAIDYAVAYELQAEVANCLRAGSHPFLRPLAELQDEYEDFIIVAADNKATRIIQVASTVADAVDRVAGGVKNAVKKGGWSQKRYARRRNNQLMHYAKEINDVLGKLVKDGRFSRIVLLGSAETIGEIQSQLDSQLAELVVGHAGADLKQSEQALVEAATELHEEAERAEEERLWKQIRNEAAGDGLAAVGANEVWEAALAGRVDKMIVIRDLILQGRRCQQCHSVSPGKPKSCPQCGDQALVEVDIVDALVRQLELTSAEVEFSDPVEGLKKAGGVAALLRY